MIIKTFRLQEKSRFLAFPMAGIHIGFESFEIRLGFVWVKRWFWITKADNCLIYFRVNLMQWPWRIIEARFLWLSVAVRHRFHMGGVW